MVMKSLTSDDFQNSLDAEEQKKQDTENKTAQVYAINKAGIKNVEATNANTKSTAEGLKHVRGRVEVTNPDLAKSGDISSAVDAIHKLNMTTFNTNQGLPQLADNLVNLTKSVQALQADYQNKGVSALSKQLVTLIGQLETVSKALANSKVSIDSGLQKRLDGLQQAINSIDFKPAVNVTAPDTKVITTPVDFRTVIDALNKVERAVNSNKPKDQQIDLSDVTKGLGNVQEAVQALRFPVPNYVLPFKDSTGKAAQVTLNGAGGLPISGQLATTPSSGQAIIGVTGTRVNLGTSQPLTNGIIISANAGNAASIEVGDSTVTNVFNGTGNGYILAAANAVSFAITNSNELWINGTAGDIVSWAAS